MKIYLGIISILFSLYSCEKEASSISDNPLIGKWLDVNTCDSCLIYDFINDNDLILNQLIESDDDTISYAWLGNNLVEIDYYGKKEYTVEFFTNDSIKIIGFTLSIIPENNSTILKKIK
jgi:hypothetical protein